MVRSIKLCNASVIMMTFLVISPLVLAFLPVVAFATSLPCLSSSCRTTTVAAGEHAIAPNDHHGAGLETNYLQDSKLINSHRPALDRRSRHHLPGNMLNPPAGAIGMKAELIRYHHSTPAAGEAVAGHNLNSSQIPMEILRSMARAKLIKTSKRLKRSRDNNATNSAAANANSTSRYSDVVQGRPSTATAGMHTDLTNGAPCEYLMKISVGSPPQHLLAVADTGSDLVWLQCTPPVPSFPGPDHGQLQSTRNFFDPFRSKTFSKLSCRSKPCQRLAIQYNDWVACSTRSSSSVGSASCLYSYFYADDSSTTGDLAVDTLHMKSSPSLPSPSGENVTTVVSLHNFSFGCGQNQFSTSMLYTNANGVVGLGRGPLSFPSQLGAQFGKRFAYCLVDRTKSRVQSSPILFGDIAVPTIPGVQYTPFIDNPEYPTYYYLALERIVVGDEALDVPAGTFDLSARTDSAGGSGGTIIDSGTTYTQLVAPAYYALLEALSSKIGGSYKRVAGYFDFCYDVTEVSQDLIDVVVPSISLHFRGGAEFVLPFQNAFILVQDDPVPGTTTMCLAMNNSTDLGFTIIGNYQQSNFHILYDLQEKRLGFVPRECNELSSN